MWLLGARVLTRGLAVIRQGQYLDGWPELSALLLNTTPARLFGLDSENRSHGSPSPFGWDVKSSPPPPPYLVPYARESKRHHPGVKGVTCVWTQILG